MEFKEYYMNGDNAGGRVPLPLDIFKRRAIAWALETSYPSRKPYRTIIWDPACVGIWDTDDILGITAEATRKLAEGAAEIAEGIRLNSPRMHHGDGDEPLPVDLCPACDSTPVDGDCVNPECVGNASDPLPVHPSAHPAATLLRGLYASVRRAAVEDGTIQELPQNVENVPSIALARVAQSIHDALDLLGWPMDGHGNPLPECKDEC